MNSSTAIRLVTTIIGWVLLMAVVVLTAQMLSPSLGAVMKIVMLSVTLIGIMIFGFTWTSGRLSNISGEETSAEALQRNRLAEALRELSNEELIRLRERVTEGDIDEEQLARLMVIDESDASKAKRS